MSDENQRRIYDDTGLNADQQAKNRSHEDETSSYNSQSSSTENKRSNEEEIFNDFDNFMNNGGSQETNRTSKGDDIDLCVILSFLEAALGCDKKIKVPKRRGVCSVCNGKRCQPGTTLSRCFKCGGAGFINHQKGPMVFQLLCTPCHGIGTEAKHPCSNCRGTGIEFYSQEEVYKIPKGVNDGQTIRIPKRVSLT